MLKIKEVAPGDENIIFNLIKDLAQYEKLADSVKGNPQMLSDSLFGENSNIKCLLAFNDDVVVGFALFFYNFSTFLTKKGLYLEDLYVKPEYRGKGYGKALFTNLADRALAEGCGRFEWSVLKWNKSAIKFYEKLGAEPMDEWVTYRLTEEKLKMLK